MMPKHRLRILCGVLCLSFSSGKLDDAQRSNNPGWRDNAITVADEDGKAYARGFHMYVPTSIYGGRAAGFSGMLVFLHGMLETGRSFCDSIEVEKWAHELGFIAVCLDAMGGPVPDKQTCWTAFPGERSPKSQFGEGQYCMEHESDTRVDINFIEAAIKKVQEWTSGVSKGRIFLVGHGSGGSMAYRVQCEKPDLINGIIAVGQQWFDPWSGWGDIEAPADGAGCSPRAGMVPVWTGVGTDDKFYGPSFYPAWKHMAKNIMGCKGQPHELVSVQDGLRKCYRYEKCKHPTELCSYKDVGHDAPTLLSKDKFLPGLKQGLMFLHGEVSFKQRPYTPPPEKEREIPEREEKDEEDDGSETVEL